MSARKKTIRSPRKGRDRFSSARPFPQNDTVSFGVRGGTKYAKKLTHRAERRLPIERSE